MDRSRRLFVVPALTALALAIGCAGPRFAAPIDGVPICKDFTLGHTKMIGGLRYPVRLRVLDGKTVVFQTTIVGLRNAEESVSTYIADDNAKYKVEWSQCGNEHAPRSVADEEQEGKARDKGHERSENEGLAYVCGDSKVYATTALETKKGDRSSHLIHFTPPPNPECWASEAAKPAAGSPDAGAPDASAAPAPAVTEDAGAAPAASDAGPAASDAGAAAPTDAGTKK